MWKLQPKKTLLAVITTCLAYLLAGVYNYEESPVISLSAGRLQGFASTSRNGRKFYQFLSIPYAQPPIGNLRFESPQPVSPWNETLDATRHPPFCKGFDFLLRGRIQGEESCLFLNVVTPADTIAEDGSLQAKYPVVVIIHGGGFHFGGASEIPGNYFMDEDVVVVTIQYRLGIFGFLSTNDEVVRGNMGLKDQVMALKWVQNNIENFGGDPNQVTILGHSAGGTSVHLLTLSKMAAGLFHRAITFAPDALSDFWQFSRNMDEQVDFVAKYFDCPSTSTKKLTECLRKLDADSLAQFHGGQVSPRFYHNLAGCGPSIEKYDGPDAFLTQNPIALLEKGQISNRVPWMVGASENEGLLNIGKFIQSNEGSALLQNDASWEEFLPHLLFYNPSIRPDAAKTIRDHFFGNMTYDIEDESVIKKLGNMISEKMFYRPLTMSARHHSKVAPVYMFMNTYENFSSFFYFVFWARPLSLMNSELLIAFKAIANAIDVYMLGTPRFSYGTSHGDEALLMYDVIINPKLATDLFDLEMSKLLVKTVADFAHARNSVKFNGRSWPRVEPEGPLKVMNLNVGKPRILHDPYSKRLKFWEDLNLPSL